MLGMRPAANAQLDRRNDTVHAGAVNLVLNDSRRLKMNISRVGHSQQMVGMHLR